MNLIKSLRFLQFRSNHKPQLISSITQTPISFSTLPSYPDNQTQEQPSQIGSSRRNNKRPLDVIFKEALGLCEKSEQIGGEIEIGVENGGLKKKLLDLEIEIREMKSKSEGGERSRKEEKGGESGGSGGGGLKGKRLSGLFSDGELKREIRGRKREAVLLKEISSEMEEFLKHLYDEGYLKDANFLTRGEFDVSCFDNEHARDYLKFVVDRFGKDKQEIAKWLSGSDLKAIALFGCPSLSKRNVFAAKRLRNFFRIPENTVCSKCTLKESCKYVNQSVWKGDTKTLNLAVVMRVLTTYALEAVPPQLYLSDDVKACVYRLMKDIMRLSKTVH